MGSRSRSRSRSHVTTKRTMGCLMNTPAFYHPDLLAVLRCEWFITSWKGDRTYKWYNSPLLERVTPTAPPMRPRDPDWVRNSHLGIELVDILNDALKAMGGWPRRNYCCGSNNIDMWTPPQMVEAFNKVCKKFNEAKLFNMGLQCRAGVYNIEQCGRDGDHALCVLVEKKVTKSFAMWARHWNILVFWRKWQAPNTFMTFQGKQVRRH